MIVGHEKKSFVQKTTMSSSLGFAPGNKNGHVRPGSRANSLRKELGDSSYQMTAPISNRKFEKSIVEIPVVTEKVRPTPIACSRLVLIIVTNILLGLGHFAIAVYVGMQTFDFPLTFFYTRVTSDNIRDVTCIFEYGSAVFGSTSNRQFCTDPLDTKTGNQSFPSECSAILGGSSDTPGIRASGGPSMDAYEVTRFRQDMHTTDELDSMGKSLAKGVLVTIEGLSASAHFFYALIFIRILRERFASIKPMTDYFISYGGLPVRWVEYGLTSALMVLYIANISNFFEVFGILSLVLSTFALMFFGGVIEVFAAQGKALEALVLLYIPGFAIFVSLWSPIFYSLTTSIFDLNCRVKGDTWMSCVEYSCFGKEVPIALFISVLFFLFCVFPLVLIAKLYILGGWYGRYDRALVGAMSMLTCRDKLLGRILCFPVYWTIVPFVRLVYFLVFVFYAGVLSWLKLLKDVFIPFVPGSMIENRFVRTDKTETFDTLVSCELLYALASATSKIFLALFFTINFAGRDW